MGTLFERALDEGQRSQLGAHYTSEADIKTLTLLRDTQVGPAGYQAIDIAIKELSQP